MFFIPKPDNKLYSDSESSTFRDNNLLCGLFFDCLCPKCEKEEFLLQHHDALNKSSPNKAKKKVYRNRLEKAQRDYFFVHCVCILVNHRRHAASLCSSWEGSARWLFMSRCCPEVSAVLYSDREPPLALIAASLGGGPLANHMMSQAMLGDPLQLTSSLHLLLFLFSPTLISIPSQ